MARVTKRDVSAAYGRMVRTAESVGLDVQGWALDQGSTTYGRAWTVVRIDPETGGLHTIPDFPPNGTIGSTTREAERFLAGMSTAFESVAYAKRREWPVDWQGVARSLESEGYELPDVGTDEA